MHIKRSKFITLIIAKERFTLIPKRSEENYIYLYISAVHNIWILGSGRPVRGSIVWVFLYEFLLKAFSSKTRFKVERFFWNTSILEYYFNTFPVRETWSLRNAPLVRSPITDSATAVSLQCRTLKSMNRQIHFSISIKPPNKGKPWHK